MGRCGRPACAHVAAARAAFQLRGCSCRHPVQSTQPRGIIEVNKCLSIKGAEDAINKPHAFEISTTDQNMYFIADSDKASWAGWLVWQCCAVMLSRLD